MMYNRYPVFFEEVFLNEGFFQDNPKDKGNYYNGKLYGTICGVTARDHFDEYLKLKKLFDLEKYELLKDSAMKFYAKKEYWIPQLNEISDSSLAFKIFDLRVNLGKKTAVKLLQKTLIKHFNSDIKPNGRLDSKTLQEANTAFLRPSNGKYAVEPVKRESVLYACYIHEVKRYYKSLNSFWKFGKGWMRRLAKILNKTPDKIDLAIEARPPENIV